jgi:acyl dehydratase
VGDEVEAGAERGEEQRAPGQGGARPVQEQEPGPVARTLVVDVDAVQVGGGHRRMLPFRLRVAGMTTIISGLDDLKARVGQHLGYSDYLEVTQDRINQFAEATGDHQWIHVDVERAKAGPFGGPIAHGFLTLSLAPALLKDVWVMEGTRMGVNYGLNKVRFPSPVPVGSKVRAGALLKEVTEVDGGGAQLVLETTFEIEGASKPACVAELVFRYYF